MLKFYWDVCGKELTGTNLIYHLNVTPLDINTINLPSHLCVDCVDKLYTIFKEGNGHGGNNIQQNT